MTTPSRSLRRGATALFAGELVVRFSGLIALVVGSRILGPSPLGLYTLATALLAYGAVFTDAGLSTLGQRRILAEPQRAGSAATDILSVQLLVSVAAAAVLVVVLAVADLPGGTARLVLWGLPLLPLQALSLSYVLQAYERMGWFSATRVVTQLVASGGGIALLAVTHEVVWLVVAAWVGAAASALLAFVILGRQGFRLVRTTFDELARVAREGLPYLGNGLVIQALVNLDILVLGVLASATDVGRYGAAYRLTFSALMVAGVVIAAAFPRLIVLWEQDRGAFDRLVDLLVKVSARVTFPLTAVVVLDPAGVMSLLFGAQFRSAEVILAVMFLWVPLGWYNSVVGQSLMAAGFARAHLVTAATSATLLAVLLGLLVPQFGAAGAAAAVAATELATLVQFTVRAHRLLAISPLTIWVKQAPWLVVPAVVMGGTRLLLSPVPALLVGSLGGLLALVAFERMTGTSTARLLLGSRGRAELA